MPLGNVFQRTRRQTNNGKTNYAKKVTSNICKKCKKFILSFRLRGINLHSMNKSDSIKNIAAALMQFSIKMDKIEKTANNPFFKSKYAPLPEILTAIKIPLSESGLIFTQFPDGDNLTTLLMHPDSGEWLEASYSMHPVKNDPQSVGSAITYARRYALGAILGLNIDEDDDGNKASDPQHAKQPEHWLNEGTEEWLKAREYMAQATDKKLALANLRRRYKISSESATKLFL